MKLYYEITPGQKIYITGGNIYSTRHELAEDMEDDSWLSDYERPLEFISPNDIMAEPQKFRMWLRFLMVIFPLLFMQWSGCSVLSQWSALIILSLGVHFLALFYEETESLKAFEFNTSKILDWKVENLKQLHGNE